MGTGGSIWNKRIWAYRFSTDIFIGNAWSVEHVVWKVKCLDIIAPIRISVSPQHWRQHVGDTSSFRRSIVTRSVTVIDDPL